MRTELRRLVMLLVLGVFSGPLLGEGDPFEGDADAEVAVMPVEYRVRWESFRVSGEVLNQLLEAEGEQKGGEREWLLQRLGPGKVERVQSLMLVGRREAAVRWIGGKEVRLPVRNPPGGGEVNEVERIVDFERFQLGESLAVGLRQEESGVIGVDLEWAYRELASEEGNREIPSILRSELTAELEVDSGKWKMVGQVPLVREDGSSDFETRLVLFLKVLRVP